MVTYGIGEGAARRIAELRDLIAGIDDREGFEGLSLLDAAEQKLSRTAATLSIVGQVKAGKSTLINALADLDDLLPTEVNPWTAVITNLHFGHPLKQPNTATFTLFSEGEWEKMQSGDDETRRMAEELLPGFDPEVLRRQVREMQESARARLGAMYQHLLGKVHHFTKVDRATLDRYVCAGHAPDGEVAADAMGRLSSITKAADIQLPAGPFRIPVTVADTPGINDPFLVRDEITTHHLKAADVFVMAISAHQPLNTADIALLKMLARHPDKRVVVFVNRCDELGAGIAEVPSIVEALDARLRAEIAECNHVICAGSAYWGHLALNGSDAQVEAALGSEAYATLLKAGRLSGKGDARARLDEASGLGRLRDHLSELLLDGPVRTLLAEVAGQASMAVDLMVPQVERRLARVREGLARGAAAFQDRAAEQIETRRKQISALAVEAAEVSAREGATLEHEVAEGRTTLETQLREVVERQIAEQVESLRAAMARSSAEEVWSFDYFALRDQVDARMAAAYEAARTRLDARVNGYALALNGKIAPVFGAVKFGALTDSLPGRSVLPGFAPRSAMLELDLSADRGWQFWKSKRLEPQEAIGKLVDLVHAEVTAATRETAATLTAALEERAAAARARFDDVLKALGELIAEEDEVLAAEAAAARAGVKVDGAVALKTEEEKRVAALEAELAALQALSDRLAESFSSDFPSEKAAS